MAGESSKKSVLVAVDHPERAAQLVRTGSDIAALTGSSVRVVTVAVKPRNSPFGVFEDATIIQEYAADSRAILSRATNVAPGGVEVDGEVIVGTSVAAGILEAVERQNPGAVVIGWDDQRGHRDTILGSTVDRLLKRLPCDLYVERIGAMANGVDSVLLPVAGGPHVTPAAMAAKSIAVRNRASIEVLAIAGGDVNESDAQSFREVGVETVEGLPGPPVTVTTRLTSSEVVPDEIVAVASEHDVIVFGATRQGALKRRFVGSIPRLVAERTDRTVILGRSGEAIAERPWGLTRIWSSIR